MIWDHIATIVVIAGFVLHLIGTVIGGTWALSQLKATLVATIASHQKENDDEFTLVRKEFGEVGAALRQKINDVELWMRDTFVRRDSFYKVRDDLTNAISGLGDKIDKRLERMENKIDNKA